MSSLEVGKMLKLKAILEAKVKDQTGKELLKVKIDGNIQKRFSYKAGKAIQIVFKGKDIVHLHCYAKDCGNQWKLKEGSDWSQKFEVNPGLNIVCKKCGRVYDAK
jgi:hypothetical protein